MTARVRTAVAWASLVALIAACGSPSEGGGGSDDLPTVTIVTYSSFVVGDDVLAAAQRRLGARIEVVSRGDAGEALSAAILTAGRPEGDVFFGIDNTSMGRALGSDLLEPLGEVDLSVVPAALRLDDSGRLAPIQFGDVCVNYDIAALAGAGVAPPESFDDLVDPRYRGMLVVENPALSSPGMVFLAATHQRPGADAASFWRALRDNDVAVAGSWDDAWNLRYSVNGGDRPLVVSYASSPPAEVYYSEGSLERPLSGVATGTCARQVEFAGVLRGSDRPDLARRLVAEMLSEPWQAALPLTNFVLPARTGVALPEAFADHFVAPEEPIVVDPDRVDADRDRWIDEWRTLIE